MSTLDDKGIAPTEQVLDAATVLILYGRWWVKGVEEQALHPSPRRSVATDPAYFEEMSREAVKRARDLGGEHVHKVADAVDAITKYQEGGHA